MELVTRLKNFLSGEGSWRGPFFGVGHQGGTYELGRIEDGFQRDLQVLNSGNPVAAKFSAINRIAEAVSIMPGSHMREVEGGGAQMITTSALSRWLHSPNPLQTAAEFWDSGVRLLMETGNCVGYSFRNDRNEITATYWASRYSIHVIQDERGDKVIFYAVQANEHSPEMGDFLVPAGDILHLRVHVDPRRMLHGVAPIIHCAMALAVNSTLQQFLVTYLNKRATPSYVLSTDVPLNETQIKQLRSAWDEQTRLVKSGGTPILGGGMKPHSMGVAPGDDRLIENFRMSVEEIARAYGVPKVLLGVSETTGTTENLINMWLATGLGALVNNIEQAVGRHFNLPIGDAVEFDTQALNRMDWEARVRSAALGSTSGVFAIDEARAQLRLGPVKGGYGQVPTQQQQQVPIDLLHEIHAANIASKLPQVTPTSPTPVDQTEAGQKNLELAQKALDRKASRP